MKSLLLTLLILAVSLQSLSAQHKISGIIANAGNKEPVVAASVRLCRADSTVVAGMVSDPSGGFIFNNTGAGKCLIVVTAVNFEPSYTPLDVRSEMVMDTVFLTAAVHRLDSVVVERNIVSERDLVTVAYPTAQQVKASSTGIDLLQKMHLPGLKVDPVMRTVSIDGVSAVIYRINGINATLEQVISLRPDHILRVEYTQAPSVRELGTDAGVIDMILREPQTGTFAYADAIGALTTGFINGAAGVKTVFSKSQLSLDYIISWRDYDKRRVDWYETYHSPTQTIIRDLSGRNSPFGYFEHNINFEYLYSGTKNIFSVKSLNALRNMWQNNYYDVTRYTDGILDASFFRDERITVNYYIPSVDIYYIHKMDEGQGIEANLVGTISRTDYRRGLDDIYLDSRETLDTRVEGLKKSLIGEAFYYNKKNRVNFNLGIQGSASYTKNEYDDTQTTHIRWMDLYAYGSISGSIKNISYTLGSGMKTISSDDGSNAQNYLRNLSTLNLFYKRPSWSLRYNARYYPVYPSLGVLSDIDQVRDDLVIMRGNPDVKPNNVLRNTLYFNYIFSKNTSLFVRTGMRHAFNPFQEDYFYDETLGTFVEQERNQKSDNYVYGAVELRMTNLLKIFDLSFGGEATRYVTKGFGYRHTLNDYTWFVDCTAHIKDFSIMASYRKPSRDLYGQVKELNENYSLFGVVYSRGNISVQALLYYPIENGTKYMSEGLSRVAPYRADVFIADNGKMFVLGFSYRFSSGKSVFDVDRSLSNADEDRGIIQTGK